MPMARFECVFATSEAFYGFYIAYNEDKGFHDRKWQARLEMNNDAIDGNLSTPAGIQVLFGHNSEKQAVGRVISMSFGGGLCRGVIELSEEDLKRHVAGGFDALMAGVNNGLSLGFVFVDGLPAMEEREGTDDDPDIRKYPRMEVREVSLTSVPRLKHAGIVRRLDAAEPEPEAAKAQGADDGEMMETVSTCTWRATTRFAHVPRKLKA